MQTSGKLPWEKKPGRESDDERIISINLGLALDDMAVAQDDHFPCIIYMRQGGDPIGKVGVNMRQERKQWFESHNSFEDPICNATCLDVCVAFNNKAYATKSGRETVEKEIVKKVEKI